MVDYLIGLARLQELSRSWGGRIVQLSSKRILQRRLRYISFAPATNLAVDYEEKTVYVCEKESLGNIIHEMGHVFASPCCPAKSEEYNFFGWEFMVAVKTDLVPEWLESTGDYAVGGDGIENIVDFKDMTIDEQSDLIEERVQYARGLGLVVGEEPIAIR